ncbi:NUDIX hydrolase [Roseinatronobacter sp.]|uniref:NUDIX hydrolase n=1 Tax=Roseinatronobacter sp. TaxID=1945755 RepID=UPI0025DFDFD4|nr:NUDIX hydrolase [Roseibaca sp.]
MIRRFGDARVDGQHYTRRHGAYAIVLQGDHVLLTHQSWPENDWQLPGGGIDANESAAQALRREVREETGWRVRPLRRLGAFRRFCYMPDYDLWAEKLCSIYLAQPLRAVGPPTEPGHRAAWRPLPEAVALLGNDGDRSFLAALLR